MDMKEEDGHLYTQSSKSTSFPALCPHRVKMTISPGQKLKCCGLLLELKLHQSIHNHTELSSRLMWHAAIHSGVITIAERRVSIVSVTILRCFNDDLDRFLHDIVFGAGVHPKQRAAEGGQRLPEA